MNIGGYFIFAGSLVSFFIKSTTGQQVAAFLTQVGTELEAGGQGSIGPIRVGNQGITVNIAPWA